MNPFVFVKGLGCGEWNTAARRALAALGAAFVLLQAPLARADVDIALGRPAMQSTRSQWSTPLGAGGAVDGIKNGRFGFHTSLEASPWWQVDLGVSQPLDRVVIYNRQDCCAERARTLHVLLSDDGSYFRDVYANDGSVFGGALDGRPLQVPLNGARARFVRLQLFETNYFHLDEVEVFGAMAYQPSPPQQAGAHPGYLHALSDLRNARANLEGRNGDAQMRWDARHAVDEIDAAIAEIKRAAIDDGKNLQDHPPVDSRAARPGRLHRALADLRAARDHASGEEDNPAVAGLRARAIRHIEEAIHHTEAGLAEAEGGPPR